MYNAIILLPDMESISTIVDFKAIFFSLLVVFIVYVISLIRKNNKMKRELNALYEWRTVNSSLNSLIIENSDFKGNRKRLKELVGLERDLYQEWRECAGLDDEEFD